MTEAQILAVRAEIEAAVSQREGMIAENKVREVRREYPAYDECAFGENADTLFSLANLLRK
jgi:hypothetical protein